MPPPEIRDLRDLTRLRKTLVQDRSAQVNRVGKILELANVKLASVVSDVTGVTGRRILDAMIDGEEDPKVPAGRPQEGDRGHPACPAGRDLAHSRRDPCTRTSGRTTSSATTGSAGSGT